MKTNKELQAEVKKLWAEIEKKDERIKALDESRNNVIESCKILNAEQKKKLRTIETGSKQISDICRSILVFLAKENGGEIRVPKNHLDITKGIAYEMTVDQENYIYTVKE